MTTSVLTIHPNGLPQLEETDRSQLSPEHAEIIKATLPLVGSKIDEITPLFYQAMFEKHPELLRDTFNRGNQKQGAQQRALAASIATFATMLVTPDAPDPRDLLERIAHKHTSLGITEDQYQIVHDHLFAAIVEVLGTDTVTPPVAEAWDEVYWIMARTLIDFEKTLYQGAGVDEGDVFHRARVTRREDLSEGVIRLTVERTDGQPLPDFRPGQYVSVGVRLADGARQLRQYSLVGHPDVRTLTFAVKRVDAQDECPAGEVSTWLVRNAEEGTELDVTVPFGDLVMDLNSDAPAALISNGIGATPMMGMLEALAAQRSARRITIAHAESSESEDVFKDEREALAQDMPYASVVTTYARGTEDIAGERLTVDMLGLTEDTEVYVCGGSTFLEDVRTQLHELGFTDDQIHFELFAPNDWLLDG